MDSRLVMKAWSTAVLDGVLRRATGSAHPLPLALLLLVGSASVSAAEQAHALESPWQDGPTLVRVFTPDAAPADQRLRTLYVLPVEAGTETRWGDPAAEIRRERLAERHGLLVVAPTFSALPWYADHPTNPKLRQESYFLETVVPLVEREYPTVAGPDGRLLVGFSKSGWGAWSLLLRRPDLFGKAAAWDAPLMQTAADRYGMGPIFGSQQNFERYRISTLVRKRAASLRSRPRLVLTGYFRTFRDHHIKMHNLLNGLGIPHVYRDGPMREHHWESGWLAETVALLLTH